MKRNKKNLIAAAASLLLLCGTQAQALTFDSNYSVRYGDFLAWDLPVLDYAYGNKQPVYTIPTNQGTLKQDVVIYNNSGGQTSINTDTLGLTQTGVDNKNKPIYQYNGDDSYAAPSGNTSNFFSTSITGNTWSDPGGANQFTGDTATTWDVKVANLRNWLSGSDMFFYFNNNQTGTNLKSISLWVWAQISMIDTTGANQTKRFDFRNYWVNNNGTLVEDPILGGQNNTNVGLYTSPAGYRATVPQPNLATIPTNPDGDPNYVFAPGEVWVNPATGELDIYAHPGWEHIILNTGDDRASYAIFSPELNDLVQTGGYDVMSIEFRMYGNNGGAENLFIKAGDTYNPPVPEPGTFVLVGAGLLGLAIYGKRRMGLKKD